MFLLANRELGGPDGFKEKDLIVVFVTGARNSTRIAQLATVNDSGYSTITNCFGRSCGFAGVVELSRSVYE